jgi:5-methyltetrahydropteroyltriglutamate--homocysteine methyltransferase
MEGFAPGGLVRSYGNRYYRKPIITGAVRWPGPITVPWWEFAQSLTDRPVKGMVTGPYTMMDWSFSEHYLDRRNACLALAQEMRHEAEALVAAGARIIQIDEPALSVRPDELTFAIEALAIVTRDLPAYFITHTCYGAFEAIYPGILGLPVENLDLAISHSSLDLLALFARAPSTKDMSVGVIDVHTHEIEPPAEVSARIRRATRLFAPATIWVSPDCGLKTRTVEEAEAKLAGMMEATRGVRVELASADSASAPQGYR